MNKEQLCEHFRSKTEPLRVDNVTVDTGEQVFQAHGTIWAGKSDFKLRLTIHNGECPLPTGIFTPEQFWKISGFIDDEFAFAASGLPSKTTRGFSDKSFSRAAFGVHSLSLGKELNAEELREKEAHLAEVLKFLPKNPNSKIVANPALLPEDKPLRIRHEARLIRFPLIWKNAVTHTKHEGPLETSKKNSNRNVFHTIIEGCEIMLTQDDDDCLIDIVPEKDTAIEAERLESIFDAFLWAIAFVSGKDAWPQEIKVSTRYQTLKHTLTVPRDTRRSSSPLLTDTACANGADFGDALRRATTFFLAHEELGETIHEMLYLSRSATSTQTPHEVGTLALCSVFEGVVDLLDEHFLKTVEHGEEATFNEAKSTLLSACKELKAALPSDAPAKARSYERLAGSIGSAKFARFKEKLIRLVAHLGLQWDNCFDLALNGWQKNRNLKAHGKLVSRNGFDLESQSRMAGAINLLVASAMGYKGLAVFSSVGERYQRI